MTMPKDPTTMAGAATVDLSSSGSVRSVKNIMDASFKGQMGEEDVSVSENTDHCDSTGVKSDTDNDNSQPMEEEKIKFTPEMTRNVFRLRMLVLLVLFVAAAAVSYTVFWITKGGETEEFESSYDGTASKVLEAFEAIVTEKLDAVASLAIAATAYSVDSQDQWPLSTVSFFQERATAARKQSGTLFASLVPIVKYEEREAWENYTRQDPKGWIQEGLDTQDQWDPMALGVSLPSFPGDVHPGHIVSDDWELGLIKDETYGPYFPVWQTSPLLKGLVNFNLASLPRWLEEIATTMEKQVVVIGRMLTPPPGNALHGSYLTRFFATMLSIKHGKKTDYIGDPFSYVFFPVFDSFESNKTTVAVMFTAINWAVYFENLLPENIVGVTLVVDNGCDSPFTYVINGADVVFLGEGDLHERKYDHMMQNASFEGLETRTTGASDIESMNFNLNSNACPYSVRLYPSKAFYDSHSTLTPMAITMAVAGIFIFTAIMFMFYDRLVERRQQIILSKATHSTAILSSIYPKNIRDRLLADAESKDQKGKAGDLMAPNHRLKSFLTGSNAMNDPNSMQPLADLFPHTTVIFADIAGFTAWSSVRDPAQVFVLLQNLYGAFDELAKRRRVFKIETIGDCYVAVTGLPHPQENHAVIMARFAHDCLVRMRQITRHLVSLGPGTDELGLRVGLHSGPVTAGVLRGDRARFQLFGDTVNTAARMESTGLSNRIQCSQNTAQLLIDAGKGHWIKARDDSVHAKGKGVLSTSWVYVKKGTSVASSRSGGGCSTTGRSDSMDIDPDQDADGRSHGSISGDFSDLKAKEQRAFNKRNGRLVDWVVEVLLQYIHEIRAVQEIKKSTTSAKDFEFSKQNNSNIDELVEIIALPKFDVSKIKTRQEERISNEVVEQLRKLVTEISMTYHSNPFHNFEHACHVTMATHKFLQRIVAPDLDMKEIERGQSNSDELASHLYDYTLGINSDPVTRCAIIFSALIHDADHRGISNVQMAKEDTAMAEFYANKSIAEQNSLDIGWAHLMSPHFQGLRQCLFAEESDFMRFRQVCVNVVLATDIFDKELNDQRKARWNKAFMVDGESAPLDDSTGLRATIVIEHIIQASDVSHTMQHWHVYRKWNRKLFQELSEAYKNGRMGADPATFWYKGELGFFDNYIIPLAKKLKECGVFGVSSEECLNYALQNRAEWEVRGEDMVKTMIEEMREAEEGVCLTTDDEDEDEEEKGNPIVEAAEADH